MLTPSTVTIFFIDSVVFISVSFLSSLSCPRDWNSLEGGKPFRSDSLDWAIPIRTESKFAQLPVIAFVCWLFFVVGFVVFVFVRVVVFCFFLCFVLVLLFLFLLLLVLLCLLCCFLVMAQQSISELSIVVRSARYPFTGSTLAGLWPD
ncbi:unnamed protein product [Polarella glacialis]|uniref:Transmembrane protein n=1 Tax=Polarella glacialis TaxID=89957 RepID=A0A813ERV6_POLGL|nr:unnamed protein product [Polarella glacialis]